MAELNHSDRAELRFVRQIPDAGYNRDIEIEATESGILIEDYITLPWDWIQRASEILGVESLGRPPAPSRDEHESSES